MWRAQAAERFGGRRAARRSPGAAQHCRGKGLAMCGLCHVLLPGRRLSGVVHCLLPLRACVSATSHTLRRSLSQGRLDRQRQPGKRPSRAARRRDSSMVVVEIPNLQFGEGR